MRKFIAISIFALILSIAVISKAEIFRGYAQESITVANTAIGFTAATMKPASGEKPDRVVFIVETAQIRYAVDGTTPTTTIGLLGGVGDIITVNGQTNANAFKAIRTGSTSAIIQPVYFTKQ